MIAVGNVGRIDTLLGLFKIRLNCTRVIAQAPYSSMIISITFRPECIGVFVSRGIVLNGPGEQVSTISRLAGIEARTKH